MLTRFWWAIVMLVGFAACNSEPVPVTSTDASYVDRQLSIEVYHMFDTYNRLDSLLPNATVKLFDDPLDRDEDTDVVRIMTTDTTGKVTFHYLKTQVYYIRVEHPDFNTSINTQFNYPQGAVTAYEYYNFY